MKNLILAISILIISSCSINSQIDVLEKEAYNNGNIKISKVLINDSSSYTLTNQSIDKVNVTEYMNNAINESLKENNLLDENSNITLSLNVKRYEPGDAFARWLTPYSSPTILDVDANLLNDKIIAKLSASSSINAGGAFTIGAYKYIFRNIADELIVKISNKPKETTRNKKRHN